jgi:hypothetical protein
LLNLAFILGDGVLKIVDHFIFLAEHYILDIVQNFILLRIDGALEVVDDIILRGIDVALNLMKCILDLLFPGIWYLPHLINLGSDVFSNNLLGMR